MFVTLYGKKQGQLSWKKQNSFSGRLMKAIRVFKRSNLTGE